MLAWSLSLYETDGLMLSVFTSDLIPWNCPIQPESYSVLRPNGTLMPRPMLHAGLRLIAANRFGTTVVSPASPPLPVPIKGFALEPLVNLVLGMITCAAACTWMPDGSRDMPAGFHHTVEASSAAAAAPA